MSKEMDVNTRVSIDEMLKEYPPDQVECLRSKNGYSFFFHFDNLEDWIAVKERVREGFDTVPGWYSAIAYFIHDNEAIMDLIQFEKD